MLNIEPQPAPDTIQLPQPIVRLTDAAASKLRELTA
jgi:hypothetical protein